MSPPLRRIFFAAAFALCAGLTAAALLGGFSTNPLAKIDDLPDLLRQALERNVAVVISDKGRRARAYGLYQGDGAARDNYPDRIIIFRDTLRRDFGHDPDLLREQVTITVRHELAHHIGFD